MNDNIPERYAKCSRVLINLFQTPQERREKYAYCKALGASWEMAKRLSSWRWFYINKYFQYIYDAEKVFKERGNK